MEQNKKLSLQDEVKKEAERIEQELAENLEFKDVKLSLGAEEALLAKIQDYEKGRAERLSGTEENVELSEELVPNFSERTNDNPEILLSEEDKEALRLGRELMKKKMEEPLHEVNTKYHKHLNNEDDKSGGKSKRKRAFRMPRKKRVVLAFAAVLVLVVGTSVTSVGSKSYLKELWERVSGKDTVKVMNVKDMETKETEFDEDIEVFRNVRSELGLTAVRFGYKPEGMRLKEYQIDAEQGQAVLFYDYGGEQIRYMICLNDLDSSLGQKEDDIPTDVFTVDTKKQTITAKGYKVDGYTDKRFIADFEYEGGNYQVKGVMEQSEFEEILESLIYF